MSTKEIEPLKPRTRLNQLLEKLRDKFISFDVFERQGNHLGQIEDLYIDNNRQINLVISAVPRRENFPRLALSSQYILKIDPVNRAIILELTQAEVERLVAEQLKEQGTIPTPMASASLASETSHSVEHNSELNSSESEPITEELEKELIQLLEERLIINRSKKKVGEVVVRKEIETRIVEVPVRREKLIVERFGDEANPLAEIDLGKGEVTGIEESFVTKDNPKSIVRGEFFSPRAASDILEAIALQQHHGCVKVRVELVLEDQGLQETYQQMFDRCAGR